ncbi:hypothetical protein OF83DRAFT_1163204 [Amylostereum chailletii]|nr:hypothetical protein OF83DRAFT_1163204 [Amylostereum chailletii]
MAVEPLLSTRAQRGLIGTQAIVVLVLISISAGRTLPCYLALFIYAEIFELVMAFDALRLRNVIQLAGILLFHMALIVFAAIQVHETRSSLVTKSAAEGPGTLWRQVEGLLISVPCLIGAAWVTISYFVYGLYYEFGWAIFRVVGANPVMKTMYQFYQIMICLLKFDFFSFTGVTMQLLIIVLSTNSAEFGLTIAAIPVVFVLLIGCGIALQHEIKWLMTASLILMLAAETYFYKLVRFYDPDSSAQYVTTRATLTVFTIVAFFLLLATFIVGIRCFYDFDKGLKTAKTADAPLFKRAGSSFTGNRTPGEPKDETFGAPLEPRMTIE